MQAIKAVHSPDKGGGAARRGAAGGQHRVFGFQPPGQEAKRCRSSQRGPNTHEGSSIFNVAASWLVAADAKGQKELLEVVRSRLALVVETL